jgi:hypothetical protein
VKRKRSYTRERVRPLHGERGLWALEADYKWRQIFGNYGIDTQTRCWFLLPATEWGAGYNRARRILGTYSLGFLGFDVK